VSAELLRELSSRPWRGNVRELRNFIDRARALGPTEALAMTPPIAGSPAPEGSLSTSLPPASLGAIPTVAPAQPPLSPSDARMFEQAYKDFREAWVDTGEKEYVRRLLLRHDRNVAAAAREAEVDRTYIYRLIRKHEL
jgi:DNA-binding NtrC family response regulator